MDKQERKTLIKKLIVTGAGIVFIIGLLYLLFYKLGLTNIGQEELQEFISSTGVIAPLIYIIVTFLQVIVIPLPTTIAVLVGSYLFGPLLAFLYSYIGLVAGSLTAFYLGKVLGRPFINWLSGGKEETDKWMGRLHGKETIVLFFMFLFPMFPDDLLCAIAGISPISFLGFLFMQIVTRATTVISTIIFMSGDIIPFNSWGIPVIVAGFVLCFVAFIYCFKNSDRINNYFKKLNDRLFKKKNKLENK